MTHRARPGRTLAIFLLATALFLLPAVTTGLPFLSTDTASYLRVGAGVANLLARFSGFSEEGAPLAAGRPVSPEEVRFGATYLAVRSPVYGFAAWLPTRIGAFWPLAVAQAALTAALVLAAMGLLSSPRRGPRG
ncbi:MAG: hypothetical protein N2038_13100 [Geminicoccaceae bacterium]|nr:hypothetical protein [Geminicoccaceae bacterium]